MLKHRRKTKRKPQKAKTSKWKVSGISKIPKATHKKYTM